MTKKKTPDKRIIQGLEWLDKEIKRDQKEIDTEKQKQIKEILSIDKTKMFTQKKKKQPFFNKILKVFGYGKER